MTLHMAIRCNSSDCENTFIGTGVDRQPTRYEARAAGWLSTRDTGHKIVDLCPECAERRD